jgi:hypothetical protein
MDLKKCLVLRKSAAFAKGRRGENKGAKRLVLQKYARVLQCSPNLPVLIANSKHKYTV